MTRFEYDPSFQTIVKIKDGQETGRLSIQECELESLSFLLWTYLQDKKFSIEVQDSPESTAV